MVYKTGGKIDDNASSLEVDRQNVNITAAQSDAPSTMEELMKKQHCKNRNQVIISPGKFHDEQEKLIDKVALVTLPSVFFLTSVIYWIIYASNG